MGFYKKTGKRVGTAMLCAVLVCASTPISVPAAIDDVLEESVCHAGHENCTYVEAVEGHPCGYIGDEDETVTVLNCHHVHDDSCYEGGTASPADAAKLNCKHVHDDSCYEVATATPGNASEEKSTHVHDEDCGYVKAVKGVRCNHECEICDELYGELKTAKYARAVDTAAFAVKDQGSGIKAEYTQYEDVLLTISGSGSVTVEMPQDAESTKDRIEINASAGDITVNLDGLKIETDWQPILITGSHTVTLKLSGADSSLKSTDNVAAIQVDKDATLVIDADGKNTLLEVEANTGAAIGSAYSMFAEGPGRFAGNIIIAGGTIHATSNKTGIGSSGYGSVGDITIKGDADVTVTTIGDDVGIGSGYYGAAGNITITDGATVNVTTAEATGIGGGYQGTVGDITITKGADVTVDSGEDNGIGSGYDGLRGATAGNIVIDGATVTVSAEETGIGNAGGGTVGGITIKDATINATGKVGFWDDNEGVAIGSGFDGKAGAINISNSTLNLNNWKYGIGTKNSDKDKEKGTGKITIADCIITTEDCTTGIRGERSTIPGSGDVEISGTLDMGKTKGTGISAGGNLDLKSGCNVTLETGTGLASCGISVNGTMNVNNNSTLVLSGAGITGDGNVTFHDGSDVEIVSYGAGINLKGDASFSDGCKVFVNDIYGEFPYEVIQVGGTMTVASGADVIAISANKSGGKISAGTMDTDTCILTVKKDTDWAGKNIEIRDKDGKSLNPKIMFKSSESYQTLAMLLPKAGDYTLYADGACQVYMGGSWNEEEKTVFSVVKGTNNPITFTEKEVERVPVTGIHFKEVDQKITLEPNGSGSATFKVEPIDATNQSVEVSNSRPDVVNAYQGAASPDVIWLEAKKPGTAIVTVKTVEGGFEATCTVTVSGTAEETEEYQLSVVGSYASHTGAGTYKPGETVEIHAGVRSGYEFVSWTSDAADVVFGDTRSADTTIQMPERNSRVRALWKKTTTPEIPPAQEETKDTDSGSEAFTESYLLTQQHTGGAEGKDVSWTYHQDGTWTADIGGEVPKSRWACLNNPYAKEGQPKGGWFYFNESGTMQRGWFSDKDGRKYYLETAQNGIQGLMQVGWTWIDGKCYYFGSGKNGETLGALVTGRKTADGYQVNDAGQWVVDGVVQTR